MIRFNGPLFDKAGEGSGAGSGGDSSLLTGDAGSQQNQGDQNKGNAQQLPPDPAKWRDFLSDEYKVHPSLKDYKDANALAKSHINLQKLLGGDKIPAPKEDWTPEQWKEFYGRLGRPDTPDKYQFKLADGFPADEALVKDMVAIMHEDGLTQKQAASILEKYSIKMAGAIKAQQDADAAAAKEAITALQKEYGEKFQEATNYARYAVKELGDSDLANMLNETGLTNNVHLFKLMDKVGRLIANDRATGSNNGPGSAGFGNMSVAEAQAAINAMMADPEKNKALYDASHPKHKEVVDIRTQLFKVAYPSV